MEKEKRLKFKCWKCRRNYSLLRQVTGQPKLRVECPFCGEAGIVDLDPYRSPSTVVFKGDETDTQNIGTTLNLPEVIPTSPAEA